MPKNYYLVLGIPSDASLDDIKEAYRRLVKEFHPDRYGPNHGPFLAIQEAYSVLSDPGKRQTHDLAVRFQKKRPPESMAAGSVKREQAPVQPGVEPLVPDRDRHGRPTSRQPERYIRPSAFDHLFSDAFKHLTPAYRLRYRQERDVNMVVTLSPEEAARGGQIRVIIPARIQCPACSGQGWSGHYECWDCSGQGSVSGDYSPMLNYPAGISPSHQLRIPLDHYGMGQRHLTVHFKIRREW